MNQAVLALAIDRTKPSTLYAGTVVLGVFKSTNSGGRWSAVNAGLPSSGGFVLLNVNALAIDPAMSSTLYAADLRRRRGQEHQQRGQLGRR